MKLSPYDLAWEIQDWSWRRATKLGAGTVAESEKSFGESLHSLDRKLEAGSGGQSGEREAVAAIVFVAGMFYTEIGGEIAPFSAVLLRSESAASSQIENLTASARALLRSLGSSTCSGSPSPVRGRSAALRP